MLLIRLQTKRQPVGCIGSDVVLLVGATLGSHVLSLHS